MTMWHYRFCQSLAAAKYKTSSLMAACADFDPGQMKALRLLSRLILLCLAMGVTERASAQDAQVVSTSLHTTCSRVEYNMVFVSASGRLQNGTAVKSLGLALMPRQKGNEIRVFSFYWLGASSPEPTNRDDTDNIAGKLQSYKSGILAGFFVNEKINCDFTVNATTTIGRLMESSKGALNAAQFVAELKKDPSLGVKDDPPKEGALEPSGDFADQVAFANAVRKYVQPVDEITILKQEIERLKGDIQKYQTGTGVNPAELTSLKALIAEGDGRLDWLLVLLIPVTLSVMAGVPLVYWMNRERLTGKPSASENQTVNFIEPPPANLPPEIEAKLKTIFDDFLHELQSNKKNPSAFRVKIYNRLLDQVLSLIESHNSRNGGDKRRASEIRGHLTRVLRESINDYESKKVNRQRADESLKKIEMQIRHLCIDSLAPVVSREPEPEISPATNTNRGNGSNAQREPDLSPASLAYAKHIDRFVASFAGQGEIVPTIEKAQKDLKEMWLLCSAPNEQYPGDCLHKVIDKSKDALQLFQLLREQFRGQGSEDVKAGVELVLQELKQIHRQYLEQGTAATSTPENTLRALIEKLAADKKLLEDFERQNQKVAVTKRAFNEVPGYTGEDIFQDAQRMAKDQQKAMTLLFRGPSGRGGDIVEAISAMTEDLNYVECLLDREVPGVEGSIREKACKMVDKYYKADEAAHRADQLEEDLQNLRTECDAAETQLTNGRTLSSELADRLHFNKQKITDSNKPVSALLSELSRAPSRLWHLRLGLSSSLLILNRAVEGLETHDRADIIDALKIHHVKSGMETFLLNLEEGHLVQEVDQGFANNWLHDLFRANLLLRTYFSDSDSSNASGATIRLLRDAISQAAIALNLTLNESGYSISDISLLEPSPDDVESEGTYKELRRVPEIKLKIQAEIRILQANGTLQEAVREKKVVVDVFSFPFTYGNGKKAGGRVATLSPSDWV